MTKNFSSVHLGVLAVLLLALSAIRAEQWSEFSKSKLWTFYLNPRVVTRPSELAPETKKFIELVQHKIKDKWAPPYFFENHGSSEVVSAIVCFQLQKDGKIKGAQLSRKSGDAKFDRAAIKAVNDASGTISEYPAILGDEVEFEMTFDFNLYKSKK